jgi:hypothetical protein
VSIFPVISPGGYPAAKECGRFPTRDRISGSLAVIDRLRLGLFPSGIMNSRLRANGGLVGACPGDPGILADFLLEVPPVDVICKFIHESRSNFSVQFSRE